MSTDRLLFFQTVRVSSDVARRIGEALRYEARERRRPLWPRDTLTLDIFRDGQRMRLLGTHVVVGLELPQSTIELPGLGRWRIGPPPAEPAA